MVERPIKGSVIVKVEALSWISNPVRGWNAFDLMDDLGAVPRQMLTGLAFSGEDGDVL